LNSFFIPPFFAFLLGNPPVVGFIPVIRAKNRPNVGIGAEITEVEDVPLKPPVLNFSLLQALA
jgi:hypothetical protein